MDFSSIIDILFIIGAIALGFFPGVKKMLGEEKTPKKVVRPVYHEPEEEPEKVHPKRKKKTHVAPPQPEQNNEYFSYETMNEKDFEQAFSENVEENKHVANAETPHSDIQLNMDEEEIYKGVIWSEILKRKY